jgi:transcriptional regulator GlxA family with amidase domain
MRKVIIAGFAPAQMLDVTGPLDVFTVANGLARGGQAPYQIVLAAPQAGALATTSGVALADARSLYDEGLAPHTLLLAGGSGARTASCDAALVARVRVLCERAQRAGSVCTGAFMLAATGLLEGQRATTHWAHFEEFAQRFPRVRLEREALFVAEGKYHSSAGISAGIDYALALVERDLGRAAALTVARELVVYVKRPGGQSQFSAQLQAQANAHDPDRFGELSRWIGEHLEHDLSIAALAARSAMSPRHFARRFQAAMNMAPGAYVQTVRLDAARRLLADGAPALARVAGHCGFASEEAMRLAFQRHLGMSPAQFRDRAALAAGRS